MMWTSLLRLFIGSSVGVQVQSGVLCILDDYGGSGGAGRRGVTFQL